MKSVYLLVGCPGSGKTWVCNQLTDQFEYVHHDLYIGMTGDTYLNAIIRSSLSTTRPILAEAPFSISQIQGPLEEKGFTVIPVVIQEDPSVIQSRYREREHKEIPKGHLTRQETYLKRSQMYGWFHGTSSQCLEHLKHVAQREEGDAPPIDPERESSPWKTVYEKAIRKDGSLYFPERLTRSFLDQSRRQMGSYLFSNQYLNIIIPDEERKFRKEWLRTTTQIPTNTISFGFIDPAIGQKKSNDYTGIAVISVDTQGIWYLRQASRHRLTPTQIVNKAFELCEAYDLVCLGIESVAYQEALIYLLCEEMNRTAKTIPIKDIKRTKQSKEARILALVPRFEWGRIFCLPGLMDFEEELLAFPRGSHDDILDALASLEELVYYPETQEIKIEQPHSQNDPNYERWYRQQLVERANDAANSGRDRVEREFGL